MGNFISFVFVSVNEGTTANNNVGMGRKTACIMTSGKPAGIGTVWSKDHQLVITVKFYLPHVFVQVKIYLQHLTTST